MNLRRWTPADIVRASRGEGRVLDFVDKREVLVIVKGTEVIECRWLDGPRDHAIVGLCPEGCHFIIEYPKEWKSKGREIAQRIPWPDPDLVRKFQSELR